jgi:putative MATE family efflux protein
MNKGNLPTELGTENIGKLLRQYAIPAIIAMTASSLYNIVDSIFIGHGVGALAISGLALTFPLMNLAAAFGSLVGVGASTLMSVRLGQKDYDSAGRILGNVITMNLILGTAFGIVGLIFLDPVLTFFGASPQTLPYAHDYMCVILLGNVVTHLYLGLNALLRSSGSPQKAMYATIASVVINTILNPLFIFGFGLGIKGSALATIISQVLMLLYQAYLFSNKNNFLHFKKGTFGLQRKIVTDSLSIGLSPFLMNAAACLIVILINQGLKKYGDASNIAGVNGDMFIGAYGIVNRVIFIFVMIIIGLNQGMQPIAGYNFGAKLYPRVTEVLKKTIFIATCVSTAGFVTGEVFPHAVASVFTSDKNLIQLATTGLRIVVVLYPLIGFQIVTASFFQSIGMAGKAIFLSLTRQMIVLVPCLIILPHFLGVTGVWVSLPAADLVATVIAGALLINQFRKFKYHAS